MHTEEPAVLPVTGDPSVVALWNDALPLVKAELNELAFQTWFKDLEPLGVVEGDFVVSIRNAWGRDWIQRYTPIVSAALTRVSGRPLGVKFVVRSAEGLAAAEAAEPGEPAPRDLGGGAAEPAVSAHEPARPATRGGLDPRYTFDAFVPGDSNMLAYTCALAVAETPAFKYNPLFLYGGSGLGKTHLLQAIGHYINECYPHLKVRFVDTQHMVDEFTDAIRQETTEAFRKRYRENDVLLVDDVQYLISKKQTQEEFFRTFKYLYAGSKQIVMTSDRPPHELQTLHERLTSRFNHGMTADINPPELETRVAILKKKVEADRGIPVPTEVLTLIAERASSNVRELEGALIRVKAYAGITPDRTITTEMATTVLRGMFPDRVTRPISIQTIQNETCRYYSISMPELIGNKRQQSIVYPRQVAMYLARELTELSLPRIGAEFGGRDHTTVIHATAKITKMIGEQREVLNQIQALTNTIKQKS